MHRHLVPLVLAVLVPGLVAQAPNGPATGDKPAAKAPFVFEPGVVDVRTLIQRCSAYLQRNILFDDVELFPNRKQRQAAGAAQAEDALTIELQLPVVTDRDGCEEMLCNLLWTRGLAVVPLDEPRGVYEVLSMYGQRAREIPMRSLQRTPEQILARPGLRQFVTTAVTLKHVNATIATNALRPFFASISNQHTNMSLTLGNVGNTTSLVLSGGQDAVANALTLLRAADVPQPVDAKPELDARIDALVRQNEQLAQRIAALEEKLKGK